MRVAAITVLLALAAPSWADSRKMKACSGPDDPAPCLIEGEVDRSQLPEAGPAAGISGNRLVLSWVGEADEVRTAGNIQFSQPMPRVAPNLFQYVVQYPKAQQARVQLRFAVKKAGKTEVTPKPTELVGPEAFAILRDGDIKHEAVYFGESLPKANVWLPPGHKAGVRYPILYWRRVGGVHGLAQSRHVRHRVRHVPWRAAGAAWRGAVVVAVLHIRRRSGIVVPLARAVRGAGHR